MMNIEGYNMQSFNEVQDGVFASDRIVLDNSNKVAKVSGETEVKLNKGEPLYMFRHMPFSRLYTELEKKTLTFVSPEKWKDPFEKAFLELCKGYDIKCLCFTYNRSHGEEWAWQAYGCDEPIVKIGIRFDLFINELSKIASSKQSHKNKFYITVCDYSLDKQDVLKCKARAKKSIGSLNLNDCINLLSIKRKAFETEKEIRVFSVKENKKGSDSGAIEIFNRVDYKNFLSSVIMEPLTPFSDELRQKHYAKLQDIKNSGIKSYLINQGIINVYQSHVYEMK